MSFVTSHLPLRLNHGMILPFLTAKLISLLENSEIIFENLFPVFPKDLGKTFLEDLLWEVSSFCKKGLLKERSG